MIFKPKYICSLIFLSIFSSCSSREDSLLNEDALILSHDGMEREYILHIPENYDSSISHPIVFNFHGFGGTATDHMYSVFLDPCDNILAEIPEARLGLSLIHI